MEIGRRSENIVRGLVLLVCSVVLLTYGVAVLAVNFADIPFMYCTDMYTDMIYAEKAWEAGSIFPDGWVFGNQLYVVATPVLSSLFYGITQDHLFSMGMAAFCMGLLVLISFNWMLKPVFKYFYERLFCLTVFMTLILASGDACMELHGWQLFFTMCSYYSCYIITAFLGFGCYIRNISMGRQCVPGLIICSLLSFATGIQSVRQTAIMVCPIAAVEIFRNILISAGRRKAQYEGNKVLPFSHTTVTAVVLTLSNIGGLLYKKLADISQTEIFGANNLRTVRGMISDIIPSLKNLFGLLFTRGGVFSWIVISVFLLGFVIARLEKEKKRDTQTLIFLFIVSAALILALDICTEMSVRAIYYFMVYPLAAIVIACLMSAYRNISRVIFVTILVFSFVSNYNTKLSNFIFQTYQNDSLVEVCDYLEDSGVDVVFSCWNVGEKIVIQSDFKFEAGFWEREPLVGIKYLCDPEIYNTPPDTCAYIFPSLQSMEEAMEIAENAGCSLKEIKHFPQSNIYVCKSDDYLMANIQPQ